MKKLILPLMLLAMVVSACGTAQNSANPGTDTDPAARTLPPLSKVAVGIFRLEGTPQAVTAGQAAQLLPLWEVYSTLSQSETAAPQEVEALAKQMQDSMTADQTGAIEALNLTQQDVFALMQEQGLMADAPQASGTRTAGGGQQFTGGFPAGGPPDGGGGGGPQFSGGFPDGRRQGGATTSGTPSADGRTGARAAMDRIPAPLIQAVIDLLKERAGK